MSAVDTAWLRMDRPHNLMMISGVLMFREKLSLVRLKHVVTKRFLVFRRFSQRPVETAAGAFWETDPDFDLDQHIVRHELPGRAGRRELQAFVSRLACTPLDPSRPMWQFHLIDNYVGGSALVMRMHHSYADGIALVRVMLSMTDATAHGPPAMPFEPQPRRHRDPEDSLSHLLAPLSGAADALAARLPNAGLWGQLAAGIVLALAWAPCVGPTLGAAFALAASGGSLAASMGVMTVFALGAATSLLVAGYGLGRIASSGRKIAGRAGQIGRGGLGMAFALVGAAILTGFDQRLEAAFIDAMPDWLVNFATRL